VITHHVLVAEGLRKVYAPERLSPIYLDFDVTIPELSENETELVVHPTYNLYGPMH
jgi:hypothetical protein